MIMKTYKNPEFEIIAMSADDVISTSMSISDDMYSGFGDGETEGHGLWTW